MIVALSGLYYYSVEGILIFNIQIMKRTLFLLICLISSVILSGQEQKLYNLPESVVSPPELMIKIHGNGDTNLKIT